MSNLIPFNRKHLAKVVIVEKATENHIFIHFDLKI